MNDERFKELVNLYFDKEISADDLKLLKSEIAACPKRERAFAERCRLHKAMRMALKPQQTRSRRSRSRRGSSAGRSRSRSHGATKVSQYDETLRTPSISQFPRWMLASGVAASVFIGLLVLPPVFRDTTDPHSQPDLVGVSEKELIEQDPLESLGKSDLRRYAVLQQQREVTRHASLISQMRLMGLRPEHTPEDKELREVNLAALYTPKKRVNQAELFQRIQGLKAIPEPKLLQFEEDVNLSNHDWPQTYEPSLVSFEKL